MQISRISGGISGGNECDESCVYKVAQSAEMSERVVPTVRPESHESIATSRDAADAQLPDRRFDVPRPEFRALPR